MVSVDHSMSAVERANQAGVISSQTGPLFTHSVQKAPFFTVMGKSAQLAMFETLLQIDGREYKSDGMKLSMRWN